MRAAFVVFVVGAALASLLQRHQAPAHSHQLVVFANNLHILLSAGYCIVMGLQFLSLRHELRKIEEQQQRAEGFGFDREIGQAFWRSTQWDLWYVTLVWMTTVLPNRPFHLGYILPMMGTWLFFGKHAEKVFNTLLIGLFGRFLLVSVLLSLAPGFHTAVGYSDNETLVLLWNLAAAFAFWLSVSLVLTILRHLRFKAKDTARGLAEALRAAEEERLQALQAENKATQAHERESMLRKALETLATRQDQAVFAKDIQRRFIFANEVLLKRLSSLAAKNSWQLENGQVKWEDVFLKTDHDIGIDCDDYRESDGLILIRARI
jgi:PAS domain-containing protein